MNIEEIAKQMETLESKIENADTLRVLLLKQGINLFLGAGFSLHSKNAKSQWLPCGKGLLEEIKIPFGVESQRHLDKACTVIQKSTKKGDFENWLTKRFLVADYDEMYDILPKIQIHNIYTTNIDNLIFEIWGRHPCSTYIRNTLESGEERAEGAINYFPFHGCVLNPQMGYVFSKINLATGYSSRVSGFESLRLVSATQPILFWGWSGEDTDIIDAIYCDKEKFVDANDKKWMMLEEAKEDEIEYYKSLGFNIIESNTKDFLKYLEEIVSSSQKNNLTQNMQYNFSAPQMPKRYEVPNRNTVPSFPLTTFFEGNEPEWSHIFSGQLAKTHHYREIENLIHRGKNIIVTGIPIAGKTTLLKQLAADLEIDKQKYIFLFPNIGDVKTFKKLLGNRKALVFIDNALDDYTILTQLNAPNIQLVSFERDMKLESIAFKLRSENFDYEKYDITVISDIDVTNIVQSIPKSLRKDRTQKPDDYTIMDTLRANMKGGFAENRLVSALNTMCRENKDIAKLLLMVSYVYSRGTPVSYDMIYSFLGLDDWEMTYEKINQVGKLIKDFDETVSNFFEIFGNNQRAERKEEYNQDYYVCRTRYLAETMIKKVNNLELLSDMLNNFVDRVPRNKICRYDIFRRSGFDADLITACFTNYDEGIDFYKKCLYIDESAFLYQQIALYATRKHHYEDAFDWIDKAKNSSKKNIFSIDNTYAMILFNANIDKVKNQDGTNNVATIQTLHQSMQILKACYEDDLRKTYHAQTFGDFTLKLYRCLGFSEVESYVVLAIEWLASEINKKQENSLHSMNKMKKTREDIINQIAIPNGVSF